MSLGFEQAGFDVVAAVEIDPVHAAVHEYNFPQTAMLCRSVAEVSGGDIRRAAGLGNRTVDVVFGGAPCQGFSMIGKRALDDPRNALPAHFLRVVVELEANYFVFENVKGLTIGDHRRFLDELVKEFERHGYDVVAPWKVLNAADFGVPQNRHRLFLLGARRGLRLPSYPNPKCVPAGREAHWDLSNGPTVWDAIGDLPDIEQYPELFDRDWTRAPLGRKPSQYAKFLRGIEKDEDDFSHPRLFDASLLTGSMRTYHTPLSQRRFAKTEHGGTEPVSRFFKLDPSGLCNTLRAGTGSDRGAYTSPRPIHPYVPRCITVREAARLHSYPDWFRFHATKWHGFRQIGNSVPPLLARAVAARVAAAMKLEPSRPTTALALGDPALLTQTMATAASRHNVKPDVVGKRLRAANE